jgi:hypothetical protein
MSGNPPLQAGAAAGPSQQPSQVQPQWQQQQAPAMFMTPPGAGAVMLPAGGVGMQQGLLLGVPTGSMLSQQQQQQQPAGQWFMQQPGGAMVQQAPRIMRPPPPMVQHQQRLLFEMRQQQLQLQQQPMQQYQWADLGGAPVMSPDMAASLLTVAPRTSSGTSLQVAPRASSGTSLQAGPRINSATSCSSGWSGSTSQPDVQMPMAGSALAGGGQMMMPTGYSMHAMAPGGGLAMVVEAPPGEGMLQLAHPATVHQAQLTAQQQAQLELAAQQQAQFGNTPQQQPGGDPVMAPPPAETGPSPHFFFQGGMQ